MVTRRKGFPRSAEDVAVKPPTHLNIMSTPCKCKALIYAVEASGPAAMLGMCATNTEVSVQSALGFSSANSYLQWVTL